MRVIAIKDCYFNDGTKPTEQSIHKGSIYHVIDKIFVDKPTYFYDSGTLYQNGYWLYELLEQRGKHVSSLFLEIPDDDLVEEQVESIEKLKSI